MTGDQLSVSPVRAWLLGPRRGRPGRRCRGRDMPAHEIGRGRDHAVIGKVVDARAALARLHEMGVAPGRILLWGESLGTGLAVQLAAENPIPREQRETVSGVDAAELHAQHARRDAIGMAFVRQVDQPPLHRPETAEQHEVTETGGGETQQQQRHAGHPVDKIHYRTVTHTHPIVTDPAAECGLFSNRRIAGRNARRSAAAAVIPGETMSDIVIDFHKGGRKIGLIVRGKQGPDQHPDKLAQHADTVEADGSPIGFFGEGNDGSLNSVGLGMQGVVYDYALLRRHRPFYVELHSAVANRVVSTVLLINVDQKAADAFKAAWDRMTKSPGDFNIVGGNCATHASAAFISAGVVAQTIPWLDTPDNLYGQLVHDLPAGRWSTYTGYNCRSRGRPAPAPAAIPAPPAMWPMPRPPARRQAVPPHRR